VSKTCEPVQNPTLAFTAPSHHSLPVEARSGGSGSVPTQADAPPCSPTRGQLPRALTEWAFEDLAHATANFASSSQLGIAGGFGTVYRGSLGGKDVAIKVLSEQCWQEASIEQRKCKQDMFDAEVGHHLDGFTNRAQWVDKRTTSQWVLCAAGHDPGTPAAPECGAAVGLQQKHRGRTGTGLRADGGREPGPVASQGRAGSPRQRTTPLSDTKVGRRGRGQS
jgi:hypothetical protein